MMPLRRSATICLLFSFWLSKVGDAQEAETHKGKRVILLKESLLGDAIAAELEVVLRELKASELERELIRTAMRSKWNLGDADSEQTQARHTVISFTFVYNGSVQVPAASRTAKRRVLSIHLNRVNSPSRPQALAVVTAIVMTGSNGPEIVGRAFIHSADGWSELNADASDATDKEK